MANAVAGRAPQQEVDKGRVDPARVKRYWPGRAPDWAQDEDEEALLQSQRRDQVAAPVVVSKTDPRLKRLAKVKEEIEEEVEVEHRRVRRKLDEEREEDEEDEEDDKEKGDVEMKIEEQIEESLGEGVKQLLKEQDDAEMFGRRAALRQRLLDGHQNEEELLPEEEEEEEDEHEDMESEYETDSEDEELGCRLIKPVFVPQNERETIVERKKLEEEEEMEIQVQKLQLETRKKETQEIVVQRIRQEETAVRRRSDQPKGAADIDTDDDKDEEKEFELWKKRELNRIKREKDEMDMALRTAEEREMLKHMTEEELWERSASKAPVNKGPKKKWKFLQKYWHKGAFFQDDPDETRGTTLTHEISLRDFSAPTGEDRVDKTTLPKVMQVKNFGRSGRTKWTHLVSEDTTNFEHPWGINDAQRMKYNKKMAASDQKFTKPDKLRT